MEQSHPPYLSGAMFQPRTINRWLDINPQNGPLSRTQTFVTLPPFNQAYMWKGYSEIIVSFNFEGPNNFSFKSVSGEIPLSPNYYLSVSWYDSKGNHVRYALWQNVGEVLFFVIPLYTGQLIRKNFRLEVWSIGARSTPPIPPTTFISTERGQQMISESGQQIALG